MKRWLVCLTIVAYLGTLFYGIGSHAMNFRLGAHPLMYFVVWDMFCGWAAYENRLHVIGEGQSGRYYQLAPGPWGDYQPYGDLGRQHYDSFGNHYDSIARNCLKQTSHEPMTRIFAVEESWPKQFNLPDTLWERNHDRPKEIHRYYHVQAVLAPDGRRLRSQGTWLGYQISMSIGDNPRLAQDSRRGQPFFANRPQMSPSPASNVWQMPLHPDASGSPLGN